MMETEEKIAHYRRNSYRELMSLPAWQLYGRTKEGKLGIVSSTRAESPQKAWEIFKRYGMEGIVIFR